MHSYELTQHEYDVVIVGTGGAGLRAAIAAAEGGLKVAAISKVDPRRSHTMAAQGGINAALGTRGADDWRWHMYDTVRGSDWLGDQDAIARLCERAPAAIMELADWGVPFTRDAAGQIYQRPYGGQTTNYGVAGSDPAFRAAAAEDRTGSAIMHVMLERAFARPITFFSEFFALDLLMADSGACHGVLTMDIASGDLHAIRAPLTILATGGYGQAYSSTTAANLCTGDGNAMVLRAGLPLQDMEFVQFHPTGLYGSGILITEGARGEGGFLRNGEGERFLKNYAPQSMELASRDVIARAIVQEMRAGRGAGAGKDHVWLDLTHLPADIFETKLPYITTLCHTLMHLDPMKQMIPVVPTVHYTMGGIPTNVDSQVLRITERGEEVVPGLMAVGEAACNSCHGANRLGCNSLLDLVVFGKDAGDWANEHIRRGKAPSLPVHALDKSIARLDAHRHGAGSLPPRELRRQLQQAMTDHAPVFRDGASLNAGLEKLGELRDEPLRLDNHDHAWNLELIAAEEALNLLAQAEATMLSAGLRTESRGAHYREDFPTRDDKNWLKHSLAWIDESGNMQHGTRAVHLSAGSEAPAFPPEARVY
jgi:succinate dehydrogenase / fumarate reductase flavoprotein subunit